MIIEDVIRSDTLDFSEIPQSYYLLGLLSAFENRLQAIEDQTMQFFAIICINLCKEPPTLRELSEILGSSHQNVKQILLKLEKKDFIRFQTDEKDKRKQRIVLTERCGQICEKNQETSTAIMNRMFDGIPQEDLASAIRTIIRIEKNMRGLEK